MLTLRNPGRSHITAVKDILRYLSGSRTRGITYGGGDFYRIFDGRRLESHWLLRRDKKRSNSLASQRVEVVTTLQ